MIMMTTTTTTTMMMSIIGVNDRCLREFRCIAVDGLDDGGVWIKLEATVFFDAFGCKVE